MIYPLRFLLLAGALSGMLTACAPGAPECRARGELDTVDRLIAETSANIDRGYVMVPSSGPGVDMCLHGGRFGVGLSLCADASRQEKAVAVDAASERRKLAGLKARQLQLKREMAINAACMM
jgi:hypothetical protein